VREREREGKDKIVDVTSENTQSVYSNFVVSDWSKKVGADRYAGGDIFGRGWYNQLVPKINFWYRLLLTADTKNKISFLYRLQLSADTKNYEQMLR
jgi:hypothetical protein